MKLLSLLPWLQDRIPPVKGILLYGTCESLISFRIRCLQKIYTHHHYVGSMAVSMEEILETLQALPGLFETTIIPKHILLHNVTDTLLNKANIIEIMQSTSHVLLTQSSKLSSRSKLVLAFQDAKETAVIPCYDIQKDELMAMYRWLNQTVSLDLTPEALTYFINFSMNNLDKFFSVFELLILYAGTKTIDDHQVQDILLHFTALSIEKFNEHFFLQQLSLLYESAQTIEMSEWLSLIRILIQDLVNLMSFHIYHLKSTDLKNFWSKRVIQFAYGRLALYEKSLPLWGLQKCHQTLNCLIHLECCIKSASPPTLTQILTQLIELSHTQGQLRE